jgi:hypothetical protein
MGQELRKKIADINCGYCAHEPPICDELCNAAYEHADRIIALIKEAGWIPPDSAILEGISNPEKISEGQTE